MPPQSKPVHFKPEDTGDHTAPRAKGPAASPNGGAAGKGASRRESEQSRQEAERALRTALMDCYNS